MNLRYKDSLIAVARIFIKDLCVGELRALIFAEKVVSTWTRGKDMDKSCVFEDLRKVVGEFYVKYPTDKVTLALSEILDVLIFESQSEISKNDKSSLVL